MNNIILGLITMQAQQAGTKRKVQQPITASWSSRHQEPSRSLIVVLSSYNFFSSFIFLLHHHVSYMAKLPTTNIQPRRDNVAQSSRRWVLVRTQVGPLRVFLSGFLLDSSRVGKVSHGFPPFLFFSISFSIFCGFILLCSYFLSCFFSFKSHEDFSNP